MSDLVNVTIEQAKEYILQNYYQVADAIAIPFAITIFLLIMGAYVGYVLFRETFVGVLIGMGVVAFILYYALPSLLII